MKYEFILTPEIITQINGPVVSIYPPSEPVLSGANSSFAGKYPVPSGVGASFTGKYITPPGSPILAHFTYTRTNTSLGELLGSSGVLGLGQMSLHAQTDCGKVVLFFSYEIITSGSGFTATKLKGQVTSARLNGKPIDASLHLVTDDGGQSYTTTLYLC